jgi:hypothetical protein
MCDYVMVTVPAHASDALQPLFVQHGFAYDLVGTVPDAAGLPVSFVMTTTGSCDCGTAIGGNGSYRAGLHENYERELARHRRSGWSEGKIRRWIEELELAHRRRTTTAEQMGDDLAGRSEVRRMVSLVEDVLRVGRIDRVGVVLMGSDWKDSVLEGVAARPTRVRLAEFSGRDLVDMGEMRLVEVTRDRN